MILKEKEWFISKYQNKRGGDNPLLKGMNYNKLKRSLLKITNKMTNIQMDYIHKLTTVAWVAKSM